MEKVLVELRRRKSVEIQQLRCQLVLKTGKPLMPLNKWELMLLRKSGMTTVCRPGKSEMSQICDRHPAALEGGAAYRCTHRAQRA